MGTTGESYHSCQQTIKNMIKSQLKQWMRMKKSVFWKMNKINIPINSNMKMTMMKKRMFD